MSKVQEKYQISPIFVFFLIHSAQFGAGVLGVRSNYCKSCWIRRLDGGSPHRDHYSYSHLDDVLFIKKRRGKLN